MRTFGPVAVLCFLAAASSALAAAPGAELGFDSDEPIAVNADNFSADLQAERGTYSGNVVVVQGAVRLRAEEVIVEAPDGRATRMEASGGVVVESPSGTATGTNAVYDIPAQVVRLTGNVVLTNQSNVMRGNVLEVRIADGRATLTGGPNDQTDGRVQGLFVPSDGESN